MFFANVIVTSLVGIGACPCTGAEVEGAATVGTMLIVVVGNTTGGTEGTTGTETALGAVTAGGFIIERRTCAGKNDSG